MLALLEVEVPPQQLHALRPILLRLHPPRARATKVHKIPLTRLSL